MTVYFIGAGPGDPELITVKGRRLIRGCPVVLYAGSLVPRAVIDEAAAGAEVINTATMSQRPIRAAMAAAHRRGLDVARVHSGDPSIYGAIGEQMAWLDRQGIPCEVVPGVTATSAAAAALRRELTLPEVSQTVILTRYPGKTPMPAGETLAELGRHGVTLAIHLGINRIHRIVADLVPHYGADCPVAVVHRVSWPDADAVTGTLGDIVERVRAKGFTRTALILVGHVLEPGDRFGDAYLYRADQAHYYRPRGRAAARRAERRLSAREGKG